jgi:hypothetical protein
MAKYIKEFQLTGPSIVKVDLICKHWNERFMISVWATDSEEKYTFVVNGKRKDTRLCKTQISKEQALEIIERLKLIPVQSPMFKSGVTFYNTEFVDFEIERLKAIKLKKEFELITIRRALAFMSNKDRIYEVHNL